MKAGGGKSEIALSGEYLAIEDFVVVHHSLYARAVVIQSDRTIILISLEMTSLPGEEVEAIKTMIQEETGVEKDAVWVCVTHTFSAPHMLPDFQLNQEQLEEKAKYRKSIHMAASRAVEKAFQSMTEVTPLFGRKYCGINVNRDIELPEGWWIGNSGRGLVDHSVSILAFVRPDYTPAVLLFHYPIQSSVLDGSCLSQGGKAVSPDIAGLASEYLETEYKGSGTETFFLVGAAGDQVPVQKAVEETFENGIRVRTDKKEEGFKLCEQQGMILGKTVRERFENMRRFPERYRIIDSGKTDDIQYGRRCFQVPARVMENNIRNLHPVHQYVYVADGLKEVQIEVLTIGSLAVVGVQPELNCITASAIRASSPYDHTIISTMVNGAAKYMADHESYDRFTYEAMNSPFGKGAAEILTKETLILLGKMARS